MNTINEYPVGCVPKERPADDFEYEAHKMVELHRRKNSDYGNAFSKAIDEIGFPYALGMIYNKTQRLLSIHNKPNINFESAEDTLIDLASYAIMLLVEMKKRKE